MIDQRSRAERETSRTTRETLPTIQAHESVLSFEDTISKGYEDLVERNFEGAYAAVRDARSVLNRGEKFIKIYLGEEDYDRCNGMFRSLKKDIHRARANMRETGGNLQ